MSKVYTSQEAAELLGVSSARVRELIKCGRIPSKKRGRDYLIDEISLKNFAQHGRRSPGRPRKTPCMEEGSPKSNPAKEKAWRQLGNGKVFCGDVLVALKNHHEEKFQAIVADPPYFQVLSSDWDNQWNSQQAYLDWTLAWVQACASHLKQDGLLYIFGQLGKREHGWLHACSMLAHEMQFHDMIIWDRAVGYNERRDSFTPQYEMILVLRKNANAKPYFDKSAVRLKYDEATLQKYLLDKRYKDKEAREAHLREGKYATNILRVPSLKGASREKIGHPSQKPIALIKMLVEASTRKGDLVLDPFLGSGTTAAVCEQLGRPWAGVENNRDYIAMIEKRVTDIHQSNRQLSLLEGAAGR